MSEFVYNNTPLPNQAAEYLTQWIKQNDLKAGDKLPTELELAQKLNVGRSTVREAIMILKSRNIVEVRRGCGTFLTETPGMVEDPLGLNFVEDRTKLAMDWGVVRLIIEPAVAELAAIHATPEDIEQITYWDQRVDEDIVSGVPHLESDIQYHRAIAKASKNIVMDKLLPLIAEGISQFMGTTNNSQSFDTRRCHHEIRDAIARHDSNAARRAMETLLCINQDRLRQGDRQPRQRQRKNGR